MRKWLAVTVASILGLSWTGITAAQDYPAHPVTMIVDQTYVTFMDTMGVGALVTGYNVAREIGTRFVLRNPSEFVHRQLRITGLADMFGLPPTSPHPQTYTP